MDYQTRLMKCRQNEMSLIRLIERANDLSDSMEYQDFQASINTWGQLMKDGELVSQQTTFDDAKINTNQLMLNSLLLKVNFKNLSKLIGLITDFNDNQMVKPIKDIVFKDGNENWDDLADVVCCFSKTVSFGGTMLGYVDAKPKQRVKRDRQHNTKNVKALEQKPVTVENLVGEEKGIKAVQDTLKQISFMFRTNDWEPIPYYHLIVDPNDFSITVQNSFNLSFLIRENAVVIEDGDDGYPQVRLLTSIERKTLMDEGGLCSQAICTLTMDFCQKMGEYYNITEPLLKMVHVQRNDDDEQTDEQTDDVDEQMANDELTDEQIVNYEQIDDDEETDYDDE